MNLEESQGRIRKLMLRFLDEIKIATAMGKRDINCVSENVLIQLFSEIYGHTDLKNLNVSEGTNFPAIDLGDKKTRTAYQITSTPKSQKVKQTLEKFVAHELYKEYDHLVIYILTEKQGRYQGTGFDEIIEGKFTFDKENDIRDYQDLLREISGLPLEKAHKVENIIEQHFVEKQEDDEPQDIMEWLEGINDLWREESGPIKIDREELRNDLPDFASRGNGIVIGSPGVGKTYLLNELHQRLKSDEIPHLLLPIDQLGTGNLKDLQSELSYKGDLIEKLKAVSVPDKKAILLFDAFDAARDENTRRHFLNLIQRAIHELNESWNIIVTVRTFDATKSQKLLDLFGNLDEADLTQYQSKDISCRHFTIPPFDKNETLQALAQIGCQESFYDDGSDDFKKILAKPFNIWLLEKILRNLSNEDLTALSQIHSEVQLFRLFWERRIENENSEHVLRQIADRMVQERSLSVRIDDIYLEKVLQLTKEENFPIDFLARLTEHVDKIWDHDPEFVTWIYRTVFAHYEISDEKIIRGGPILPMATFRHQDYRMCQYRLEEHLRNFLQTLPLIAARTVIQSLNFFIIRFHIAEYTKEDGTFEDLIKTFDFGGKLVYFVEDNSYMWDEQQYTDEPIEMANTLFEFISELAVSGDPRLNSLLDVFRDEVWVAFFWKRLLKIASQFPKIFASRLFELCIAKPIQLHFETSYELGLFLKAAALEFTPDKLLQIEESILAIPEDTEDNREFLEMCRDQLLAQIPVDLLSTDEAKKIREEMERKNDVPENQPPVRFSTSWGTVTEEKRFQDKGIDTSSSENQELHRFFKPLNEFSSEWMNDAPTVGASKLILPQLQEAHAVLKSDTAANTEVIDSLWHKLTACMAILSRVANNLESESFTFCRQVLLEGAKHEKPEPNPRYDNQFNSPGYSPFPRHKASQGLLRLAFHQPDEEILDAIEALANDPVPSVRMVTAMELFQVYDKAPEKFWHIVEDRATDERNLTVQEYLYLTLTQVAGRAKENEDKTTHVMAKLLEHTPLPPQKLGSFDPFNFLLMNLAIKCENSWALKTIEDKFFKDPIRFSDLLTRAVSQVMKDYVVPKYLETPNGLERARRAIEWLEKVIDVVSNSLGELHKTLKEHETEEVAKQLHDTYKVINRIITRLYYEVAHKRDQSEKQTEEISPELRGEFYDEVKPLMKQIVVFAQNPEHGLMFAPTAHYFMQLLTSFLSCNPKEVLHLAAGVVKSSEPFGYNLDAIAVMDVVEFVEIVLADYRHEIRNDEECLEDLLNLLDMFAKTGWTDALKLVWRLDEVFR